MKILTLSSVFPNPRQPTLGVFVLERIARVAKHCEVVIVAPIPWFPGNRWIRGPQSVGIPLVEEREGLTVYHPRFLCIPSLFKSLDPWFYALSLLPFLYRLRRRFRFDLLDTHFIYPDGVAAVFLGKVLRIPVTITLRGVVNRVRHLRLHRPQVRWALARADRIFCVSNSLREVALELGASPEKCLVVPNGVEASKFHPLPRNKTRQSLNLSRHGEIILSVGRLIPGKGYHHVLQVLPTMLKDFPNLLYLIIGEDGDRGRYLSRLRQMISELSLDDHVRIVGPRPHEEIPRWLAAADLFCLATESEGWCNALLEALACGVPIVSTRVGGNKEVVRDGLDGLLIKPGNPAVLAETLKQGLRWSWNRGEIATRTRQFTWEATAERLAREFRHLLAEHPTRKQLTYEVNKPCDQCTTKLEQGG